MSTSPTQPAIYYDVGLPRGSYAKAAEELALAGWETVVLVLTHNVGVDTRWSVRNILRLSQAMRAAGLRVEWLVWTESVVSSIERQAKILGDLLDRWVPAGVCLNAEPKGWMPEGVSVSGSERISDGGARSAVAVQAMIERVGKPGMVWSVATAASLKRDPEIDVLVAQPGIERAVPFAYKFHNPQPEHWSGALPSAEAVVQRTADNWRPMVVDQTLQGVDLALAAHFQQIPDDSEPYHSLRASHAAATKAAPDLQGERVYYWSERWVRKDPGAAEVIEELIEQDAQPLGPPTTPPAYHGKHDETRPTLRRGMRGASVRELQELLARGGFEVDVDGVFGSQTDTAIERLQLFLGADVDGVVGAETWPLIDKLAEWGVPPSEPEHDPEIEVGVVEGPSVPIGALLTHVRVDGRKVPVPDGVVFRQGVRFKTGRRRGRFERESRIFHINAGPGNPSLFFKGKGFGVPVFVELDGTVWIGGDIGGRYAHAGALNDATVGIEARNAGRVIGPKGGVWAHALQDAYIESRRFWGGSYMLPTAAQGDALVAVYRWLSEVVPGLSEAWWHQRRDGHLTMRRQPLGTYRPGSGAHVQFSSHGDGLEADYVRLRVAEGCGHTEALLQLAEGHGGGRIYQLDNTNPGRPARPLGPKGAPLALRRPWQHGGLS